MCKNISTPRTRLWRNKNRCTYNSYMKKYRNRSLQKMLYDPNEFWFVHDSRKRKALKSATPSWADLKQIRKIYEKCEQLNQKYPSTGFVVHHVVPISNSKVCGLHIPENLKIISLNMKKKLGRKFYHIQLDLITK